MEISPRNNAVSILNVEYLALNDLQARWIYTRQGVHKLVKSKDFPTPSFTLNRGKTRVWSRVDVEAFEKTHPELFDEAQKLLKMKIAPGRAQLHGKHV